MTTVPRSRGILHYRIGELENQYDELLESGTLSDNFTIYDSFHDHQINEKPYLRRLAIVRGRIDALVYLLDLTSPDNYEWIDPDPETLRSNIEKALTEVCTERGGVGSTWTAYLRGWGQSVNYALNRTPTPSSRIPYPAN